MTFSVNHQPPPDPIVEACTIVYEQIVELALLILLSVHYRSENHHGKPYRDRRGKPPVTACGGGSIWSVWECQLNSLDMSFGRHARPVATLTKALIWASSCLAPTAYHQLQGQERGWPLDEIPLYLAIR
jgi:hypothetical protein